MTLDRSKLRAIGGSSIAAALGISKWSTPHGLWLKLTKRVPDEGDKEAFARGRALEPTLARVFADGHFDEFKVETMGLFSHKDYDFLVSSPDRILLDVKGDELLAGLEIKTASVFNRGEWGYEGTDQIPVDYLCQCQWYCGMLGVPEWHLIVGFVEDRKIKEVREYKIVHNETRYQAMIAGAVEYWNTYIVPDKEPPITGSDTETEAYYGDKAAKAKAGDFLEGTEDANALSESIFDAQRRLEDAKRDLDMFSMRMIALIGEHEGVRTEEGLFTVKRSADGTRTDWKKICAALKPKPELISQFTTDVKGSISLKIPKQK